MAKKHSNTTHEGSFGKKGSEVAVNATYELFSILTALKRHATQDLSTDAAPRLEPAIIRTSVSRCIALTSIVMSILDEDTGRPLADVQTELSRA